MDIIKGTVKGEKSVNILLIHLVIASFEVELWEISCLFRQQIEGIRVFFETPSHVFVTLPKPTGSGRPWTLIYQCLPFVADCLDKRLRCTSTLAVISPPQALMKDQVDRSH
mgnify:CR=1 FL=1